MGAAVLLGREGHAVAERVERVDETAVAVGRGDDLRVVGPGRHDVHVDAPPAAADVVYARGHAANFATLVLSGKLHIRAGRDGFRAEAGPWTLLGAQTLLLGAPGGHTFVPDFAAHVATDSVRCVHVSCEEKIKGAPRGRGISEELVNDPTVSRKDRLTARVQGRRKDLLRATATGAAVV